MNAMKKGRIAENIVRDLFKEAGFTVIPYGYEHTVSELADRARLIKGKAGEYIRHQPDFIVINDRNEAFFVEVKHRSSKLYVNKDIFPYPNCYVLLLTKNAILAQSTAYLFRKSKGFEFVNKMPPFKEIPVETILKYVKKVRRQLGDETLTGQFVENYVEKLTGKKLQEKIHPFEIIFDKKKRKTKKSKRKIPKKRWKYRKFKKR